MKIENWELIENRKMERTFKFKDFKEALHFVIKVGELAEKENHHPDILLFDWNSVKISLATHAKGGLTEKDFDLASEINRISY